MDSVSNVRKLATYLSVERQPNVKNLSQTERRKVMKLIKSYPDILSGQKKSPMSDAEAALIHTKLQQGERMTKQSRVGSAVKKISSSLRVTEDSVSAQLETFRRDHSIGSNFDEYYAKCDPAKLPSPDVLFARSEEGPILKFTIQLFEELVTNDKLWNRLEQDPPGRWAVRDVSQFVYGEKAPSAEKSPVGAFINDLQYFGKAVSNARREIHTLDLTTQGLREHPEQMNLDAIGRRLDGMEEKMERIRKEFSGEVTQLRASFEKIPKWTREDCGKYLDHIVSDLEERLASSIDDLKTAEGKLRELYQT